MKKMYRYIFVVAVSMMFIACGGNKESDAADSQIDEIEQALERGEGSRAISNRIDSMALEADDLTPAEAVQVLVAYIRLHEQTKQEGNAQADMEILRKYVDVYDIVTSVGGDEMRSTFDKLARRDSRYNLAVVAKEYRSILADYADGVATEEENSAPQAATAQTDSVKSQTSEPSEPASTTDGGSESDEEV